MRLDPRCNVARAIARDGKFEPHSLDCWRQHCRSGQFEIALDVGAYSGLYAVAAAKEGKHAIAFEPRKNLVVLIKGNANLNGVLVEVRQIAVSDKDGTADLYWNPNAPLNATARFNPKPNQTHKETVHTVCLDSLSFPGRVGIIKVDVEGHEAEVLRGAQSLLRTNRPVLLIETMDHEYRKDAVKMALCDYAAAGFLDKRNLLMVPR